MNILEIGTACLFIASFFIFSESVALAEGSVDLGSDHTLKSETILYVDILNPSDETFRWLGTGSIMVTSPTGIPLGTYNPNDIINPVESGAYRVNLSEDQNGPWEIIVSSNSSLVEGRLYSTNWFFDGGSYSEASASNSRYFVLVPAGNVEHDVVVEIFQDGIAGFDYKIVANQVGVSGSKSGMSVPLEGNTLSTFLPVYINVPEIAHHSILSPTLDNFTAATFGPGDHRFSFNTNVEAAYHIVLDIDGDGIFNLVGDDVVISGVTNIGSNIIVWDGLDSFNQAVPVGSYNVKVFINIGELHIIMRDVETIYPGLRLFLIEQNLSRSPVSMYWNDTLVQSNAVMMPNGEFGLQSSGPFGFESGNYADATEPNINAHSWGDFSGNGKGNDAYIDTFCWIDGLVSNTIIFNMTTYVSAPTADAGPDRIVFDTLILDGSHSLDEDGTLQSFDWKVIHRENPAFNKIASTETATIASLEPGFYDVSLTVTDNDGLTDTDTFVVGAIGLKGDLDLDGDVDGSDLSEFTEAFGTIF